MRKAEHFRTYTVNRFVKENSFLTMPTEKAPLPTFAAATDILPNP